MGTSTEKVEGANSTAADLITQLTWPLEKDEAQTSSHHLFHRPYLQSAQVLYKQAILHYPDVKILRKIARVTLPALAQPQKERSVIEDSVIKVVLYLFRNIVIIKKPDHLDDDEDDSEISRSATIDSFHSQEVLNFLLTIGSGANDEFTTHDVELLDILFHLVKGIDVDRLFMERDELASSNTKELQSLIGKEHSMHMGHTRTAPSRHNRFGTMVWMKRNDGKMSTIFGHTAATNEQTTLHEMDKSKKWKKPRRPAKMPSEDSLTEFNGKTPVTGSARKHLRQFVERFLDSSFNPLFLSLCRTMERETPRLMHYHPRQYFFMIAWLLRAESARRRNTTEQKNDRLAAVDTDENFGLVASVLGQETFVLLSRRMQKAQDDKDWQSLNACMKCFTQILLTVQDMSASSSDEDQEIAENTLNRIFYEAAIHDQLISLLRTFKDQGFGYLDALTELAHVFLRALERYSKQNVDMQVRRLRKSRKKKQALNADSDTRNLPDRQAEAEDLNEAQRVSTERKFDFMRFSARFVNQGSIETFVSYLKYYKELGTEQLKRAHRFLHRAAFKMELSVYLFRADIVLLLQKLVKGPDGMDQEDPTFKEWEELVRHVFRLLVRKMQARPSLGVELLFSKIPNTVYFLEHGHEKEVPKHVPRVPAELEVKPGLEENEQIGVAVSALINQSKFDHLSWLRTILLSAVDERQAWETQSNLTAVANDSAMAALNPSGTLGSVFGASDEAQLVQQHQLRDEALTPLQEDVTKSQPSPILVRPDTPERRLALQRDKYVRLLLTLLSFQKLDITESDIEKDGVLTSWTIPPPLDSARLQEFHDLIAQLEFSPPAYEDGKTADDFLRRKYTSTASSKLRQPHETGSGNESESEGGSIRSDGETQFPAGGPTARKPDHASRKKGRRRQNRHTQDNNIDEGVLEEKRAARRKLERERAAKIKSQLYISMSDDEENEERDREFFGKEAEMRKCQAREVQKQSMRLRGVLNEDQDIDEDGEILEDAGTSLGFLMADPMVSSQKRKMGEETEAGDVADDDEMHSLSRSTKKARHLPSYTHNITNGFGSGDDDAEEDTDSPVSEGFPSVDSSKQMDQSWNDSMTEGADHNGESDTPPSSQRPSSGNGEQQMQDRASVSATKLVRTFSEDASSSDKENQSALHDDLPRKRRSTSQSRLRRTGCIVESDSDE